MQLPGHNPNPTGINGAEMDNEQPQGNIQRLQQLAKGARLAGSGSASAINTPRRAQRAAQRPTAAPAPVATPPGFPPVGSSDAPQDYHPQAAQVWAALAAEPDASPLVKSLAAQAQQNQGG